MLDLSRSDAIVSVKIGDAEINCKPYRSEHRAIANLKAGKAISDLQKQRQEELEQGVDTKLPNFDDVEVLNGTFVCIFNTELAKQVILDWKGVGLKNEELPLNHENIELFMADGVLQEQFVIQYMKLQNEIEEEKK